MPGQYDHQGRKWDESDFEFQTEEMSEDSAKDFKVDRGRVFDVPTRHRQIKTGITSKSIAVCIHGRLITHACPTCEYEADRLLEGAS